MRPSQTPSDRFENQDGRMETHWCALFRFTQRAHQKPLRAIWIIVWEREREREKVENANLEIFRVQPRTMAP